MSGTATQAKEHLADLHARAAELGIPRYRMLSRDELAAAIEEAGKRKSRGGERKRGDAGPKRPGLLARLFGRDGGDGEAAKGDQGEERVSGKLTVMQRRFGFLDVGEGVDDVYVSAPQIRRFKLRTGDTVEGPVREPHSGERRRALARVERVNGKTV